MSNSKTDAEELATLHDLSGKFLQGRKDLKGENCLRDWRLLLTEDELKLAVQLTAREIEKRFEGQDIVLTCILKGASYFTVDVSRAVTIPNSLYFIEASSYGNEQTQQVKVELLSILVPSKFKGRKVVLLDELFDNGVTLNSVKAKLIEELKLKVEDVFTITLLSKLKETHHPPPDFVAFPYVPDVWVVGYGLDDAQEKKRMDKSLWKT